MSSSKDVHSKSSTEEFFDSGIQSESNLSSGVISETNSKYGLSSDDCERDSRRLDKDGAQDGAKSSAEGHKSQLIVDSSTRLLDSGLDIDLSDQFSGLQHDNYDSAEISSSSSSVTASAKLSSNVSAAKTQDVNLLDIIFQPDENGNTRLHLAIGESLLEVVTKILRLVPESRFLDIRNNRRQTCLHLSVLLNQPKITRLLLLAGAKTGIEDRNGNTALHLACERNHFDCVVALLSPITAYEQKYILVVFKYKPVIDRPEEYINEYNYDGVSCIHMAAIHPDLKVLHQLFMSGADINIGECKGGYTILHKAVESGNLKLVKYILQHSGIDVEKKNYARFTPYQLSGCHSRIAKILLDSGACRSLPVDDSEDEDYSSTESDDSDDEPPYVNSSPARIARIAKVV